MGREVSGERTAFEAHIRRDAGAQFPDFDVGLLLVRAYDHTRPVPGEVYANSRIQCRWEGWQARAALVEKPPEPEVVRAARALDHAATRFNAAVVWGKDDLEASRTALYSAQDALRDVLRATTHVSEPAALNLSDPPAAPGVTQGEAGEPVAWAVVGKAHHNVLEDEEGRPLIYTSQREIGIRRAFYDKHGHRADSTFVPLYAAPPSTSRDVLTPAERSFFDAALHAIGIRAAYGPDHPEGMNPSKAVHEAWKAVHLAERARTREIGNATDAGRAGGEGA